MVSGPIVSASPRHLLEIQILGLTSKIPNQRMGPGLSVVYQALQRILMHAKV